MLIRKKSRPGSWDGVRTCMLGEYTLEADRCTLRWLARPWDPYRTHRVASVAASKILSKIGVDGRREAALKLLTLVLLLIGKRTLGPKTAKPRQPRRRESPSTLSSPQLVHYNLGPLLPRERPTESARMKVRRQAQFHLGLLRNRLFQQPQNGPGSTFLVCR